MRYDPKNPRDVNADRFVLSKGHGENILNHFRTPLFISACPVLYAAWHEAGLLSIDECMELRKIGSDLEGHPTPVSFSCIISSPSSGPILVTVAIFSA